MDIKKTVKLIIFPFTTILYSISGFIPRNPKIWVFGTQKDSFTDNTKHLFISITTDRPDVKAIWITANKELIKKIRNNDGIAYHRWSLIGIIYTIRAKYWFVTTTVAEIDYYTSNGAIVVNQWHGIALKKIYFDTDNLDDHRRYHKPLFFQKKVYEPFTYRLSDFVISTSNQVSKDSFSSALKVKLENCLNFGQSRTDIFFFDDQKHKDWIVKWESDLFISIIDKAKQCNYVWIYMPTWRENNPRFLEEIKINYSKINYELCKKGELLIMKLHPYTPVDLLDKLKGYSNIILAESSQDIYPLLKYTDALITDYSSIYIDYLLLNKPIIFFCFDLEEYISKSRGFYYNYSDLTPGIKVTSAKELENILCATKKEDNWNTKRTEIRNFFYDYIDGKSAQRIAKYFTEKG